MWTADRVLELRALGVERHRDVTHLAIKDASALTALKVDEHSPVREMNAGGMIRILHHAIQCHLPFVNTPDWQAP